LPSARVEIRRDRPERDLLVLRVEHPLEPLQRLLEPGDELLAGRLLGGLPALLEALGPGAAALRRVLLRELVSPNSERNASSNARRPPPRRRAIFITWILPAAGDLVPDIEQQAAPEPQAAPASGGA
jgi:hypothetical protein